MRGGAFLSNFNLAQTMQSLEVGRQISAYTGVVVHAGQDGNGNEINYSAGNTTGYVLEVDNPIGTQRMADGILAALKLRGIKYNPFAAGRVLLDPSAEIGDGVTVNSTDSVILSLDTRFGHSMYADVAAPFDEEVDHEFQYKPKMQREFKRESSYTRSRITQTESQIALEVARATAAEGSLSSRITINADSITSEVTRATSAEGSLSSRITLNADNISAEVTRATGAEGGLSSRITQNATDISAKVSKTGGNAASFGWTLTDSSWTLTSNNTTVLKATSSGVEVNGKITATSGTIGGVTIQNGVLSGITDTNIATGGISGGSGGSIAAGSLTGGNIASNTITGGTLGNLVAQTIENYNLPTATISGIGYGTAYGLATTQGTTTYPSYFRCGSLTVGTVSVTNLLSVSSLSLDSHNHYNGTITINGTSYNVVRWN